jgi:chloramphenicol 3-O phosphotransferase
VTTQVIVLNGGSSSGKTGIARCLKAILPQPWISIGVDDLLDALPPSLTDSGAGIAFGPQGEIVVGAGFREIEAAWMAGVAAMARAGARVILDEVFSAAPPPRSAPARTWTASRSCGSGCAAIPTSQSAARSPAATGWSGWRPRRPTWCTEMSSTTSRSTPATESLECAGVIAARVT